MGEPTDSTAATLAEDQVVVLDEGHEQLGLGARLGTDLYHNPLILVPAELFYRAAFAIEP